MVDNKTINKIITEVCKKFCKLKEVRYIDNSIVSYYGSVLKKDQNDALYNQEPIKDTDKIRVYHGCGFSTAVDIVTNGLSGQEYHPRRYSYENVMNPLGIFVSIYFDVARSFGNEFETSCVIEFTALGKDLEAPVWNGQNNYFVQGTNPRPFNNKEERNAQKEKYRNDALNITDYEGWDYKKHKPLTFSRDFIRKSDKPELALSIFEKGENQALYMGELNPNQIKRIWVRLRYQKTYQPYSVKDFIRIFIKKNKEIKPNKRKLYYANEDFIGWDDFFDRLNADSNYKQSDEEKQQVLRDIEQHDNFKLCVCDNMFPKQIIQAFGKEFFDEYFNRLGQ
jgi:hypothetical protein